MFPKRLKLSQTALLRNQTRCLSQLQTLKPFSLDDNLIKFYSNQTPNFGFNGLGELVYRRTYSRLIDKTGEHVKLKIEEWYETIQRVVEGVFKLMQKYMNENNLKFDFDYARKESEEMYKRMFNMKFLPAGRGLWAMGTPLTEERNLHSALNNCAFISTQIIKDSNYRPSLPFEFQMDCSMLGIGVGFDCKGEGYFIPGVDPNKAPELFTIPDSREGWVEGLKKLLLSHFEYKAFVQFDYSAIRKKGSPIKGFGGVSSGYEPLKQMYDSINNLLMNYSNKYLTDELIVDLMNLIGVCVVSGNVRRTAEIAFGNPYSKRYLDLKNYKINKHRETYGWTSNNSVFAELGMDYTDICERILVNGEPGLAWLENMRNYSRMCDPPDYKDINAEGGNPCLEQTLESGELCNLIETFPDKHESIEDYLTTLKYAYIYGKIVTLGNYHWDMTQRISSKNRRLGISMSGIQQFIANHSLNTLKNYCNNGYKYLINFDNIFSNNVLNINNSIKLTSIKPSGTVSLLNGSTAGMHWPESCYYIRRVRIPSNSPLLKPLEESGYYIEPAIEDKYGNTVVCEFLIDNSNGNGKLMNVNDITIEQQLNIASFLQYYWADSQVSCTVTFNKAKEGVKLKKLLDEYQWKLKGISFLPRNDSEEMKGVYKQMPYESISKEEYYKRIEKLKKPCFNKKKLNTNDILKDDFCDSKNCLS